MKKILFICVLLLSVNAHAEQVPYSWKSKAQIEVALDIVTDNDENQKIAYIKLIGEEDSQFTYEILAGSCIYEINVQDEYVHRDGRPIGDFYKYKAYLSHIACD